MRKQSRSIAWIIHDFTGEKRKDALKGVMNTGFSRTRHSLSEHPRDDILLYTTAVLFLLPTLTWWSFCTTASERVYSTDRPRTILRLRSHIRATESCLLAEPSLNWRHVPK